MPIPGTTEWYEQRLADAGVENPKDHAQVVYTLIQVTWKAIDPLIRECTTNGTLDAVEVLERLRNVRERLEDLLD